TVLASNAYSGRKAVRSRRPRPNHRHINKTVGARAGVRIENVMKTPGWFKGGAVAAGHRKRHVLKLNRAGNAARHRGVADADPPRMPIRVAAKRTELAEIDHGALETFIAQQVGDRVGDKALRDAVQRDAHTGTCERDAGGADVDLPEIHKIARHVAGLGRD